MLWLILLIVFGAVVVFVANVEFLWSRRQRVKLRVDADQVEAGISPFLLQEREKHPIREWFLDLLSSSGRWGARDFEKISAVRKELILAGYRHAGSVPVFFGLRGLLALMMPIPFISVALIRGTLTPFSIIFAFGLSAIGYFLPNYILSIKVRHRQNQLDRALPDIMDLLLVCMEAGLALNAAINRVAEEIRGVYHDFYVELQTTSAELRTGIPWDEAFNNLGSRTEVQSIKSMVGLMVQSDKLGASIGQALRNHGEFVRAQRALRAEEQAAKLPLKMIFPLIFCIFPSMLIVSVGPAAIFIATNLLPILQKVR